MSEENQALQRQLLLKQELDNFRVGKSQIPAQEESMCCLFT